VNASRQRRGRKTREERVCFWERAEKRLKEKEDDAQTKAKRNDNLFREEAVGLDSVAKSERTIMTIASLTRRGRTGRFRFRRVFGTGERGRK